MPKILQKIWEAFFIWGRFAQKSLLKIFNKIKTEDSKFVASEFSRQPICAIDALAHPKSLRKAAASAGEKSVFSVQSVAYQI